MVRPKKIGEFKSTLGKVAQNNHYQVSFDGLSRNLFDYLRKRGVDRRFITEKAGLLCSSASIPGSLLGTKDVFGNFTGVQEKFAHTRIFTELTLEFYVDKEYKMIKFLEHWMEYISSGSEERKNSFFSKSSPSYYYRMKYPRGNSGYKTDRVKVLKFDRDYDNEIEYTFIGLFPLNLSSTPVAYGQSDVLKASCVFSYERYIAGKDNSLNVQRGNAMNKIPLIGGLF